MTKILDCMYCGVPNYQNTKFCISCNARFPDCLGKFALDKNDDSREPQSENKYEKETIHIPKPGDIVSGLFFLTDLAASRQITPLAFTDKINSIADNVNAIFPSIYEGIEEIATEVVDYRNSVVELIEFVQFMFKLSFQELALFGIDSNITHLCFGRMLAQRAELEYIQIMEKLRSDASLNPFSGQPDVLGALAFQVAEGKTGIQQFREKISDLERLICSQIKNAHECISQGIRQAKEYDGTNDEAIIRASEKLAIASDLLSRTILNLIKPEEIKKSVDELILNTIQDLKVQIP